VQILPKIVLYFLDKPEDMPARVSSPTGRIMERTRDAAGDYILHFEQGEQVYRIDPTLTNFIHICM